MLNAFQEKCNLVAPPLVSFNMRLPWQPALKRGSTSFVINRLFILMCKNVSVRSVNVCNFHMNTFLLIYFNLTKFSRNCKCAAKSFQLVFKDSQAQIKYKLRNLN